MNMHGKNFNLKYQNNSNGHANVRDVSFSRILLKYSQYYRNTIGSNGSRSISSVFTAQYPPEMRCCMTITQSINVFPTLSYEDVEWVERDKHSLIKNHRT